MDPAPRPRALWDEHHHDRVRTFRLQRRGTLVGSIFAAILCALLSLFLVYVGPACHGGGAFPIFAMLEMALPIGLFSALAASSDLDQLRVHILRIDPDRTTYGQARAAPETTLATADVHDVVPRQWGGFDLVDRDGQRLLSSYIDIAEPGLARIRAALLEARAPRTYRG